MQIIILNVLDLKALGTLGFRLGAPNVYDGDGDDDDGDDNKDDDDDDDDDNATLCPMHRKLVLYDDKKKKRKKKTRPHSRVSGCTCKTTTIISI